MPQPNGEWPPMKGVDDHPDNARVITRDNLPTGKHTLYRRKADSLTPMVGPIYCDHDRPVTVHTIHGPVDCWQEFMCAIDSQGYPYPIALDVLADTYDAVDD